MVSSCRNIINWLHSTALPWVARNCIHDGPITHTDDITLIYNQVLNICVQILFMPFVVSLSKIRWVLAMLWNLLPSNFWTAIVLSCHVSCSVKFSLHQPWPNVRHASQKSNYVGHVGGYPYSGFAKIMPSPLSSLWTCMIREAWLQVLLPFEVCKWSGESRTFSSMDLLAQRTLWIWGGWEGKCVENSFVLDDFCLNDAWTLLSLDSALEQLWYLWDFSPGTHRWIPLNIFVQSQFIERRRNADYDLGLPSVAEERFFLSQWDKQDMRPQSWSA